MAAAMSGRVKFFLEVRSLHGESNLVNMPWFCLKEANTAFMGFFSPSVSLQSAPFSFVLLRLQSRPYTLFEITVSPLCFLSDYTFFDPLFYT